MTCPQLPSRHACQPATGDAGHDIAMLCYMMNTRPFSRTRLALLLLLALSSAVPAAAQSNARTQAVTKSISAIATEEKITIDGRLDELVWQKAAAAVDFVQTEPYPGRPATEKTEVRVAFDVNNLYIAAWCYDSEPERVTAFDLRRDFDLEETDAFGVILDAFHDRRNGFAFFTNPYGAKRELQAVDDGRDINVNWEGIWSVRTEKRPDGWAAEISIPFKTLRFRPEENQVWGINFLRRVRRKNEIAHWSPVPLRFQLHHVSYAGELRGLGEVRPGHNLKVKPFATAEVTRLALSRKEPVEGDAKGGVDAKYGLTPGLTLDMTYNTDFSQVEVDEQQINLTRFPLFFPEKREFFLESAGLFQFGEVTKPAGPPRDPELYLFFTRRIGLSAAGEPVPILGGARLTGWTGKFGLGLLNIQTQEEGAVPGYNFTVARLKRQILGRSDVGAIFINRGSESSAASHRAAGVDANFRLLQNWRINSFFARTWNPGVSGQDMAGKIGTDWTDRRIDFYASYMDVGENFNAQAGHVRRAGIRLSQLEWGYHYRPQKSRIFRDIILFKGVEEYTTDRNNRLVTKLFRPLFRVWFHDGAVVEVTGKRNFERLDRPFLLRANVVIPAGDYYFDEFSMVGNTNKSRKISFDGRFSRGDFYDGRKTSLSAITTFRPHYRFSAALRYDANRITLPPAATFTTRLASLRLNYAFNTHLFLSAFLQYNSDSRRVSSNVRLNLIHRPMSDFFVVYNEQRDTAGIHAADKSLTFKFTNLFDF